MSNTNYSGFEIAVIGLALKFPGAENKIQFWNNILRKEKSSQEIDGLKSASLSLSDEQKKRYISSYCTIGHPDQFDSNFFNYPPVEAALMDPQSRMFHETVWKALEDANIINDLDKKVISLFAGGSDNPYWKGYTLMNQNKNDIDSFSALQLGDIKFLNSLISYKLNLKGPAVYVDTACSTSLVAIHMASRSLLTGECEVAVAGGISFSSKEKEGYFYDESRIFSNDGNCRAFNTDSTGTMPGEGTGVVVLKRLQEAIKDEDYIYAVIKGSAINNDGNRKVGYTAPSVDGQTECIKIAQKVARVKPGSLSYIETHGTGTTLGDPIELAALKNVFAGENAYSCALGAVKSNIGHLDVAAGVAGFIKTVLALNSKKLPPVVYSDKSILSKTREGFYLNEETCEWKQQEGQPLRAGVSSFGIGGTNAHVVLEEAPQREQDVDSPGFKLLTLSAKTKNSLQAQSDSLTEFLLSGEEINLSDMAYTYQTARKPFTYRRSIVYKDKEDLMARLSPSYTEDKAVRCIRDNPSMVFMFSGAGSQYSGMGRDLYREEPLFRQTMDEGFSLLKKITGLDYAGIIFPENESHDINKMVHTQPMIFLFGYSLSRLVMSWGIKPGYMIGHSVGEYIAACLSGVMSFEDALYLVVKRGQLLSDTENGLMISVPVTEEEAQKYCTEGISIAAVNGPNQVVFSGSVSIMSELTAKLEKEDVSYIRLYASHAGHSSLVDAILPAYRNEVSGIQRSKPQIPFVSNLTGNFIQDGEAVSVEYWLRHMRETVRFSDGINTLLSLNKELVFIEIGGGHSLSTLLRQQKSAQEVLGLNLVRHPNEKCHDVEYLASRMGNLWCHGLSIDWKAYHKSEKRKKIPVPTYAFEKIKFRAIVNPFRYLAGSEAESYQQEEVVQDSIVRKDRPHVSAEYAAPVTDSEKKLAGIFEAFFNIEAIGVEDDFFELGGDSLKAMMILKKIMKEYGVQLSVKSFFEKRTIKLIASEVDDMKLLLTKKDRNFKIKI